MPTAYEGDEFPSYENVRLSYYQLEGIIHRKRFSCIYALKNQKAVYLITDKKKGMLLQRWSDYVRDGHGGNTRLKELVKEKGFDYIKDNFRYSILENYNARIDDKHILDRETWWKETLRIKKFGYNGN